MLLVHSTWFDLFYVSHTSVQLCVVSDLHSAAAIMALCRLLVPSSSAWIISADESCRISFRQPLAEQFEHMGVCSADYEQSPSSSVTRSLLSQHKCSCSTGSSDDGHSCSGGCSYSSISSEADKALLGCFASAAAAARCLPAHMRPLLYLVTASEQAGSRHLQHTTASAHLLHVTLDCCLLTWPAAAFDAGVLQQLLQETVPVLLSSSRSLAALAGLRALHIVLLRGLLQHATPSECSCQHSGVSGGSADGGKDEQEGRAGQQEPWQQLWCKALEELVGPVCSLLRSGTAPIRLEVSSRRG